MRFGELVRAYVVPKPGARPVSRGDNMRSRSMIRWMPVAGVVAGLLTAAGATQSVSAAPSPGAEECLTSAARVADGSTAKEPELYPKNEANAYGVIKDSPRLPNGSVEIPTVFHVVSDHDLSTTEKNRWTRMITDQMEVLNDSYSGQTAADAADSPFRFD